MAEESLQILLIDNASEDDSVAKLQNYLKDKEVSFVTIALEALYRLDDNKSRVILVLSDKNLGFAGGNNALLKYALLQKQAIFAWLFNNDAITAKDALQKMVEKMKEKEKTFIVGSVILDFDKPDIIQSCGVKYYPFLGVSKLILKGADWSKTDQKNLPLSEIDFQHGASLLVRLSLLKEIGLMDERFFLYFEEQDWQYKARDKGYGNELATESLIYHKGSVSTSNKKHLFFYYYNRSAILFARKHSNLATCIFASLMLSGITLIRARFYFKSVFWGIKGLVEAWN
jgi:GT2 family glycosyltransferase